MASPPAARPVEWEPLARRAARARIEAQALELDAVRIARLGGVSWEAVARVLGDTTGETLRRRYGAMGHGASL